MNAKILEGDCLAVMATLDANSIDAVICDPPYGLGFMGVKWDTYGEDGKGRGPTGKIKFDQIGGNSHARVAGGHELIRMKENQRYETRAREWFSAALRIAKPGAYLLAFGGTRTHHRLACAIEDAGWEIRDCLMWLYGSGFPKARTQLKPAWEPIIMARRPGPLAALNVEECRTAYEDASDFEKAKGGNVASASGGAFLSTKGPMRQSDKISRLGRWPANVLLDESAADALDEQSGTLQSNSGNLTHRNAVPGSVYGRPVPGPTKGISDKGGASRFFYTAKASRAEREAGLEHHEKRRGGSNAKGFVADVAKGKDRNRPVANHHPTVKPLDLMQWLCRLITPKGGVILDPFCGSGTTGRAAVAEGFSFLGIELDPEYAAIARARIAEYAPLFGDVA